MCAQATRAERLEEFLEHDPDNTDLLRDVAQAWLDAGEPGRAVPHLERLRASAADDLVPVLNALGSAYGALGEWGDAVAALERAVAAEPQASALWFNLGYSRLMADDASAAREAFQRAAQQTDAATDSTYYLALACDEMGDAGGVRRALDEVLQRDPAHRKARVLDVFNHLELGDLGAARSSADEFLRRAPEDAEAMLARAQVALADYDAMAALDLLERAARTRADDAYIEHLTGQACLMLARYQRAAKHAQRAAALTPDDPEVQVGLGWSWLFSNHPADAAAAFQAATAADEANADAWAGLAAARFVRGDTEAAREALETALRRDPQSLAALFVQGILRQNAATAEDFAPLFQASAPTVVGGSMAQALNTYAKSSAGRRVSTKIRRLVRRKARRDG